MFLCSQNNHVLSIRFIVCPPVLTTLCSMHKSALAASSSYSLKPLQPCFSPTVEGSPDKTTTTVVTRRQKHVPPTRELTIHWHGKHFLLKNKLKTVCLQILHSAHCQMLSTMKTGFGPDIWRDDSLISIYIRVWLTMQNSHLTSVETENLLYL